ncbi:MAG: PQQ-binding-like beta-propeller repeat protein [Micromonosporaceae bacterium]
MASGFVGRLQTLVGLAGVIALGVSASLVTGINPLDYADDIFAGALDKLRGKLSDPKPQWSERVDGRPIAAAVGADRVVVLLNGAVEVRRLSDGGTAWNRTVDWAVPTGDTVVAGRANGGGYEVLDTGTGRVRWQDTGAREAWPYTDVVIGLTCSEDGDGCTLRARGTGDGATRWSVRVDTAAQRLSGHPDISEVVDRDRMLSPSYPGAAPPLVGLVGDRNVTVVDTGSGGVPGRLPEDAETRVAVAGDRVLGVTARAADGGGCRYSVRAWNRSGGEVWSRTGYDLGTVSGSGCEQRVDPLVAGQVVAAVTPDDRPVLLDVRSGSVRWTGRSGSRVIASGSNLAVVRSRDGHLIAISTANGAVLWSRPAGKDASVFVLPEAVVVRDAGHLTAIGPGGTVRKRWKSQAAPIGAGPGGLVLANGRTVGYAVW